MDLFCVRGGSRYIHESKIQWLTCNDCGRSRHTFYHGTNLEEAARSLRDIGVRR